MKIVQENQWILKQRKERGVLIAAHRGTCGGNVIQNTCMAFENALLHGADIIEVDVIRSTDGDFFAFHNGQEPRVIQTDRDIRKMTTKEIESFVCINQLGEPVNQRLERLDLILEQFKGRCLINIDRAWFFWKEIIDFLDGKGMQKQIMLKSPVQKELLDILEASGSSLMYMPIVKTREDWDLVQSYDVNLMAAELIFEDLSNPLIQPEFMKALHDRGILTWVNAITLNDEIVLSAHLDDDRAIKDGYDSTWGKLAKLGFDMIQTDWPALLSYYLRNTLTI